MEAPDRLIYGPGDPYWCRGSIAAAILGGAIGAMDFFGTHEMIQARSQPYTILQEICMSCCGFSVFVIGFQLYIVITLHIFAPLYCRMFGWVLSGFHGPHDLTESSFFSEYV